MKNFLPIIALFFLLASCKDAPQKSKETDKVEAEKPQENKGWQSVTSEDGTEPIARHEAAFVQVGDKFYLLGGRDIRPVSIYHTQTKSWSQGLKPPIELHHFQPVVFEDKKSWRR